MDANGISNICRNDSAITVISTANNENIPYSVNDKSEGLLIQSATSVYDHKSSTDSTSNKQPPPLKGVRVCCTGYGVQQRTSIYTVVSRLGGSCVRDLTDDTTHLIAGTTDSEKHKVAISRNIPVVKPAWLFTCKKLYMKGLPVDIPALTKEFTVKLLSYKHICLTGLDIDERQRLQDLIMQHGGCYAADLVPNCTHLIASIGQGIKYQYAIKWKINIVNVDWLYESIKQQVCLPEADYPVP
ncbi:BRCT domain-containing protein [Syncephalis plumigaleata]|nr:BRCT domain-containing protein [Syncephalis plumigaleata]